MGSKWAAQGYQKAVNWDPEKSEHWGLIAAGRWEQWQTHKASWRKACASGNGKQGGNLVCSGLGRTAAFGLGIPAQPWGQTPTCCPRAVLYPLSSHHPNKLCGCAGSASSTLARSAGLLLSSKCGSCRPELSCVCASRVDITEVAVIECYIPRLLRYGYSKVLQLFSRSWAQKHSNKPGVTADFFGRGKKNTVPMVSLSSWDLLM